MVTIDFTNHYSEALEMLTQWNANQTLMIRGLSTQATPVIAFSNRASQTAVAVQARTVTGGYVCDIPNGLLTKPYTIYVDVRVSDGTGIKSIERGRIRVRPTSKPDDYEYVENITLVDITSFIADIDTVKSEFNSIKSMVGGPSTAGTKAAMTDTSKVYVYTGSETGMVTGNWYYHDGTNWVSGGVYNAIAVDTDKTLSVDDMAADAAAAGSIIEVGSAQPSSEANKLWIDPSADEIEIPEMSDLKIVEDKVDDLKSEIKEFSGKGTRNILPNFAKTTTKNGVTFKVNNDGTVTLNGTATANTSFTIWDESQSSLSAYVGRRVTFSGGYSASIRLNFYENSNDHVYLSSPSPVTFELAALDSNASVFIYVYNGAVCNNITIKPMLNESGVKSEYVPYNTANDYVAREKIDIVSTVANISTRNILQNLATTTTKNGVTFKVNNDGTVTLNGTATANTSFTIWDESQSSLSAYVGRRVTFSGGYSASIRLNFYENSNDHVYLSSPSPVTFELAALDDLGPESSLARVFIYVYSGTNCNGVTIKPMLILGGTSSQYISPITACDFEAREKIEIISPYARKSIKNKDGYRHQAFPGMCWWNGEMLVVSRVGYTHFTPEDVSLWGGAQFDTISLDGVVTHRKLFTSSDFSGLNGEIRDGKVCVSEDGQYLIFQAFTNYYVNGTKIIDNVMAVIDADYNIANYKVENNVLSSGIGIAWGNILQTPQGHLLRVTHGTKITVKRTTSSFNGDVSQLVWEDVFTLNHPNDRAYSETTIGYYNSEIVLISRVSIPSVQYGSDNSIFVKCTDMEGTRGWAESVSSLGIILHAPRLLQYYTGDMLLVLGAKVDYMPHRYTAAILVDTTANDNAAKFVANIDNSQTNYSGYCDFVKMNKDEYTVSYAHETSDGNYCWDSDLYYKRINLNSLFPPKYIQ